MLGLYEYIALNIDQRAEALWRDGMFLEHSIQGSDTCCSLYTVYGFYVEVMMSSNGDITDVVAFRQGERLDKYMSAISLADLKI